jgi:Mrp family chromosome partitioning ATPase
MSRNFDILRKSEDLPGEFRPLSVPGPARRGRFPQRERNALVVDEITRLVQRVFILPETEELPDVVAFSGVEEGAGSSWVCARASEVLAGQVPGTVCLVDANLRSPSLHEYFRIERGAGFVDAMRDSRPIREFARRAWGSNLWLVTAGAVGKEPNGALNPARLRTRFAELREEFDFIVIDTPPAGSYPDAVLLGQLADGIILVVGSNSTRREPARIAKESFEAAKIPILGAVLNRRTYPIPEAIYRKL